MINDVSVWKFIYRYGAPIGKMADVLKKDIAAFARELVSPFAVGKSVR
jgi:hypothetical protein